MKRSPPSENFYSGLSLYYDLGYEPDGEYNMLKNVLKTEEFLKDDATVKQFVTIISLSQ